MSSSTKNFCFIFLCFVSVFAYSQEEAVVKRERLNYSWGIGREHAGLGLNVLYYPKGWNLGVFSSVGYPVVKISYSLGIKYRFFFKSQKTRYTPYASFNYGYHNAFIAETNHPLQTNNKKYSKIIYGSSISIGVDTGPKISKKHYVSFGINFGLNNKEANEYEKFLLSRGYKKIDDNIPISFVLGLRFVLD
ncbi:MAG: hypothetical protein KF732_09710 [Flavobacteriales bacterium]|nr:hypothetical protein [Flavobacteriales bacterium]MBX2960219.1 hypothetical protein [Flavobacteriales bacterium]HRN41927.1 hypothetical protein [Vicingus sp.]HRP59379.1 hypothetical protein [Vicingus sp.]